MSSSALRWSVRCGSLSGLLGGALFLSGVVAVRAETVHQEARSQSTSVSTAADGTTTTTITEKVTRDGKTTTSRRTVVTKPGDPPPSAPANSIEPPNPPVTERSTAERARETSRESARNGPVLAREVLDAHNRERRKHGVGDLSWEPKLARLAEEWAHHLCRGGRSAPVLQHRPQVSGGPGENLWAAATTEATSYSIGDAVKSWASEEKYYSERTGRCKGGTCGHYTQLMWHNTKQVGCAFATCPAGAMNATIWACNYAPAGNFANERPY